MSIDKPQNPGEWYAQKTREATAWADLMAYALLHSMPQEVLKVIETRLESARYVGD